MNRHGLGERCDVARCRRRGFLHGRQRQEALTELERESASLFNGFWEREKFNRNAEPLACNPAVVFFFSPPTPSPKPTTFFFLLPPLNCLLSHTFLIFCEPGSSSGMKPEEEMWFLQLQWRFTHEDMLHLWGASYNTPPTTSVYAVHLILTCYILNQHLY